MTPETERLMTETDARRSQRLPLRELLVEGVLAALLLAGMLALALLAPADRAFNLPLAAAFVAGYVILHRLEFRVGAGNFTPTELLVVPMLLLLPTPLVPLLVAFATMSANAAEVVRGRRAPNRLLLAFNDAGFALTPAVVLVALGAQTPDWDLWPAYLAALAAQFAADFVRDPARAWFGCGVSPRAVAPELVEAHRVDAMLAPAGLLVAFAAIDAPAAVLLVLPLLKLFQGFAAQHDERVEQTIELSRAYRGTALLLGDLLKEDDEYTGHHTQDVVELSLRVADQLGVDAEVRRDTELGALLHDIGKIAIPGEIINKPGPLDDEEWALMKTHTVVGQQMLDRVGGLLAGVGVVVRASHERFDGHGYPDGLTGCEIPLAARIIIACDSFNAMTTTRPYRPAMALDEAVTEMRRCSGTQFDPNVVDALLEVVDDPGWQLTLHEPLRVPASLAV
ncbi:HD-GYP domain-containing protein [Solirubrobacter taibaiensis]|nr:HD-GYP domain-containing protein [Solirubrobacter taibaiensis]